MDTGTIYRYKIYKERLKYKQTFFIRIIELGREY